MGAKAHRMDDRHIAFHCPGCEGGHMVSVTGPHPVWGWNGSLDMPTFTPSILLRSGHFAPGHKPDACWCTWNAAHPEEPSGFKCGVCHSFVTEGRIQFLNDCTHKLAGQTVEIPDWDI